MTKTAFVYRGKKGTYIKTEILHKAPKGEWKGDIIKISYKTAKQKWARVMTPYEAIITANALLAAAVQKI